jgi:ribosomal protein L32
MSFDKPIMIDGQEFTIAPPPDHSCYSCVHYTEECTVYSTIRYCWVTSFDNLHTWPFAHTVCKEWVHERAPQVEES